MPGGRPRAFKSKKELEDLLEAYWADCERRKVPITMSGLAFFIGIDRTTIINYGKNDEYFHTVKKARDRVQADMDERLQAGKGSAAGIIFSFKNNFPWADKMEHGFTDKEGNDVKWVTEVVEHVAKKDA